LLFTEGEKGEGGLEVSMGSGVMLTRIVLSNCFSISFMKLSGLINLRSLNPKKNIIFGGPCQDNRQDRFFGCYHMVTCVV